MERIILVSRDPADREHLVALVESVFPECTVEILEERGGWSPCRKELPKNEQLSHVERGVIAKG
jgi:hypothetical protein